MDAERVDLTAVVSEYTAVGHKPAAASTTDNSAFKACQVRERRQSSNFWITTNAI